MLRIQPSVIGTTEASERSDVDHWNNSSRQDPDVPSLQRKMNLDTKDENRKDGTPFFPKTRLSDVTA
jgi:hypothetical protein